MIILSHPREWSDQLACERYLQHIEKEKIKMHPLLLALYQGWRLHVLEQLTGKSQQHLEALAFEALVVRLYALGELSSGEGAKLLDLSRREFLDLLGHYHVSLFDDAIDLKKEAGCG